MSDLLQKTPSTGPDQNLGDSLRRITDELGQAVAGKSQELCLLGAFGPDKVSLGRELIENIGTPVGEQISIALRACGFKDDIDLEAASQMIAPLAELQNVRKDEVFIPLEGFEAGFDGFRDDAHFRRGVYLTAQGLQFGQVVGDGQIFVFHPEEQIPLRNGVAWAATGQDTGSFYISVAKAMNEVRADYQTQVAKQA
jgi:hypothetical protein